MYIFRRFGIHFPKAHSLKAALKRSPFALFCCLSLESNSGKSFDLFHSISKFRSRVSVKVCHRFNELSLAMSEQCKCFKNNDFRAFTRRPAPFVIAHPGKETRPVFRGVGYFENFFRNTFKVRMLDGQVFENLSSGERIFFSDGEGDLEFVS